MITRKQFIWLSNRSHSAFVAFMLPIGGSLNAARTNLEGYLRACDAYRRNAPVLGVPDMIQQRAAEHLGQIGKSMWRKYHAEECLCNKQGRDCPTQGSCIPCLADYSHWEKQIFNIRVFG